MTALTLTPLAASSLILSPAQGNLPVLAVTYNADGTPATVVQNGATTTFTYNTDGTLATASSGGVTVTFTYNADGTLAGAS